MPVRRKKLLNRILFQIAPLNHFYTPEPREMCFEKMEQKKKSRLEGSLLMFMPSCFKDDLVLLLNLNLFLKHVLEFIGIMGTFIHIQKIVWQQVLWNKIINTSPARDDVLVSAIDLQGPKGILIILFSGFKMAVLICGFQG